MYKFEISADSSQELREKMLEFAHETISSQGSLTQKPQYIDDDGSSPAQLLSSVSEIFKADEILPLVIPHRQPYAPPVINAPGAELDSRGLRYDSRIHAATKSFNKDGSWRNRRGVDETLIAQVEAELRGQPHSPAPLAVPPPPAPTITVELPKFDLQNPVNMQGQPVTNPWESTVKPEAVPAQPMVAANYENVLIPQGMRPAHSLSTFKNNLTLILAKLITEKKIDQTYVRQLCDYFQIKEIWNVLASERHCIELYNTFGELGFITKMD